LPFLVGEALGAQRIVVFPEVPKVLRVFLLQMRRLRVHAGGPPMDDLRALVRLVVSCTQTRLMLFLVLTSAVGVIRHSKTG